MNKRGQAAMEFLMTYGWAILAVLISIAALAYFGVLNPSIFLPESCTLFPGLACTDFSVNNVAVTLTVRNGLGQNLNPFTISIPGCPGSVSADNGLSDGEKETIILTCNPGFVTNSKLKKDIDVTYTATSLSHTRKGSITAKVENDYVSNGGFEYGTSYWGLDLGCGTGVTTGTCSPYTTRGFIDSTTSHSGSSSYKIDVGSTINAASPYPFVIQGTAISLPSATYTLTFWAKEDVDVLGNSVGIEFWDSGPICGQGAAVTTDWTKITVQCPTAINGVSIAYRQTNRILWVDDVKLTLA